MYRKISKYIEEYLVGNEDKILCIDGVFPKIGLGWKIASHP